MPSNEQRREAAKRKLERQLERRAERARKRKQMTIAGTALGVVVVVGVVGGLIWLSNRSDDDANTTNTAADDSSLTPQTAGAMPAGLSTPLADTVSCSYPADGATASKANNPPRTDGIPTTAPDATPSISVETSQGNIGLTLDGTKSPCTVNSFVSLAQQDYFNDTTCHRMTTSPSLQVLQCGDPSGTGTGGPGYGFDNEFPPTTRIPPPIRQRRSPSPTRAARLRWPTPGGHPVATAASSSSSTATHNSPRSTRFSARSTKPGSPLWTRSRPADRRQRVTASRI